MRKYLWSILAIGALGAMVFFANVGASESDIPYVDRWPVEASFRAWMDLRLDSIDYDNMTVEEKEADTARFYVNGEVMTQDWVQSAKLYRASLLLAVKQPLEGKARRDLLEIALKAAKRCLDQKSDTVVIAIAPCRLRIPDQWFWQELLEILSSKDLHFEHEATRAYSVSLLYEALDKKEESRAAMEEAYLLAPDDGLVSFRIKRIRKEAGDFDGALNAIEQSEPNAEPNTVLSLSRTAQCEFDKAEVFLASKSFGDALLHGQKSWDAWDALEAKWKDMGIANMPTLGFSRNKCATVLGLARVQEGDVQAATRWLKASLTDGEIVRINGYDLRLAEALVSEPGARDELARYLEAVKSYGPDETRAKAEKLLQEIKAKDGQNISASAVK